MALMTNRNKYARTRQREGEPHDSLSCDGGYDQEKHPTQRGPTPLPHLRAAEALEQRCDQS